MNNNEKTNQKQLSYELAEKRALEYYNSLNRFIENEEHFNKLIVELKLWRKRHRNTNMITSIIYSEKRKPKTNEYSKYIKWLEKSNCLENYLDRSISYIYMRDLGKDLTDINTTNSINKSVKELMDTLTKENKENDYNEDMKVSFYKKSQEENTELTAIWLFEKLKLVSENIPDKMSYEHAQRKLIKIILGVMMHETEIMDEGISKEEKKNRLERAIRLGYAYGLTYPFIDDIFDANILSEDEEMRYSNIIKESLTTGEVPEFGEWNSENKELMEFVEKELKEAFLFIKDNQTPRVFENFLNQAYIFFNSQEVDRVKDLNKKYTNENIIIPVILKSSYSRLIARAVTGVEQDCDFDKRTFYYGIYNQLSDDFADMFEDLQKNSLTPYTYFLRYNKEDNSVINPFKLYLMVVYNLIFNIYGGDEKTKDVIFSRVINGLRRFKEKIGEHKFNEIMHLLLGDSKKLLNEFNTQIVKANNIDFLDKLLRDNIASGLKKQKEDIDKFKNKFELIKDKVNNILYIKEDYGTIVDASNYSLLGGGKRLRPVIAYLIGVDEFDIKVEQIEPVLKTLEYMHTASLIFDDLPSQDNATMRRGRKTLHEVYNTGISELSGLYLTQRAIRELTMIKDVDTKVISELVNYACKTTEDMCKGQVMDLTSKGKDLSLEELNKLCFYKTGLAFEASFIMPSILKGTSEKERDLFKKFSYHVGIMFQIKDDILDLEGDSNYLGKLTKVDERNSSSTFVTILGLDGAKKEMWNHYIEAYSVLENISISNDFLKYLLDYIINRKR
ncbi:MAG: polyprenyl synthetase family protein [Clostridium sp.]